MRLKSIIGKIKFRYIITSFFIISFINIMLDIMFNIRVDFLENLLLISIFVTMFACIIKLFKWGGNKNKDIKTPNNSNPYMEDIEGIKEGRLPKVNYSGVILSKGEVLVYASPAEAYDTKEKIVGYEGSSTGYRVNLAKGFSVGQRASKGVPIRDNIRTFYDGDFVLTTRRAMFISNTKNYSFKLSDITAIPVPYTNSFSIVAGSKSMNLLFNEEEIIMAHTMLNFAIDNWEDIENVNSLYAQSTPGEVDEVIKIKKELDEAELQKKAMEEELKALEKEIELLQKKEKINS